MNYEKTKILGAKKESKSFFGKILSTIDNSRVKSLKKLISKGSFDEESACKIAVKIKDDIQKLAFLDSFKDESFRWKIILTLKNDNNKIAALKYLEDKDAIEAVLKTIDVFKTLSDADGLFELLDANISIDNPSETLESVANQMSQAEKIKAIENDDEKIKAMSSINSEYLKAEIAKTLIDDDKKIHIISMCTNDCSRSIIARALSDPNKILDCLEYFQNQYVIADIASAITDEEKKLEIALSLTDKTAVSHLLSFIQDDDAIIKIAKSHNANPYMIQFLEDENKQIDFVINNFSYNNLEEYLFENEGQKIEKNSNYKKIKALFREIEKIKTSKDDNKKLSYISSLDNEHLKIEIIKTISDDTQKMSILETLSPEAIKEYRNVSGDLEFIKNNIEKFMQMEGFSEPLPEGLIDELYQKNNFVVQNIDFRILDETYLKLLGNDKINLISCYPDVQKRLLQLDEKQTYIFSMCIDTYMQRVQTDEWTLLASKLLDNISLNQYKHLLTNIQNVEELSQQDLTNLTQLLQGDNWCNITTLEQLRNLEEIRRNKCNKIMQDKSAPLQQKREAVIQKIFGHDLKSAEIIIQKFGEDIESIDDCDAKFYVETLKALKTIRDPNILNEIFNSCEFVQSDSMTIERTLKNEYQKLFNQGLYTPQPGDLLPNTQNIYEAGTDFKMLMTSVGAYYSSNIQNYKEDWNRPAISTQHFCASYIRNDMIGTAPIENICYGFSHMKEDSLMLSGSGDIASSTNTFNSTAIKEKYYSPEGQINNTQGYNEMDFRRIQGGEKKQPDYILVFRRNGKIPNMDKAQIASEQWGGMPIVIVDVDKCLESEQEKVTQMIQEYKQSPSPQLEKSIKQKIRNNRITSKKFCHKIDDKLTEQDNIEDTIDYETGETTDSAILSITEEDLAENYQQIDASERKREMSIIKNIYLKIKKLSRGDERDGK